MIILCLLAAAAVLWLLISWLYYMIAFYSPHYDQNRLERISDKEEYRPIRERTLAYIRELAGLPWEEVSVRSYDGITLKGRYLHVCDGAPVAICFHGYRATSLRNFCGSVPVLRDIGINILLADQRAQGASKGHTITMGVKESRDILPWIRFAQERLGEDCPIILYGISMGASAVLFAAGLDLPDNVKGIVSDSPYCSPDAIVRKVCGDKHLPAKLMMPMVYTGARIFGHFSLSGTDAAESVRNSRIPILVLHGEDDRFVPCEMSEEIYRANPEYVTRLTFPDTGHALAFLIDTDRYVNEVHAFLRSCLKNAVKIPDITDTSD